MINWKGCFFAGVLLLPFGAAAAEKYTFRESLHAGQTFPVALDYHNHVKADFTNAGNHSAVDQHTRQRWNVVVTVLEVRDGSASAVKIVVAPDSVDTQQDGNGEEVKTPCAFAGQTVTLRRGEDESITGDYKSDANSTDLENLKGLIYPDADFFPDHPVSPGDIWDVSPKLSKHEELGPKDLFEAHCRLDEVEDVNGRPTAEISCSCGSIRHEADSVEEDVAIAMTLKVDVQTSQIIDVLFKGTSTYSTPPTSSAQTTGGTEFEGHGSVTSATTQPTVTP